MWASTGVRPRVSWTCACPLCPLSLPSLPSHPSSRTSAGRVKPPRFCPAGNSRFFCKIFHLKQSQSSKSSRFQGRQARPSLCRGNNMRKKDLFYFFPSKAEQRGRGGGSPVLPMSRCLPSAPVPWGTGQPCEFSGLAVLSPEGQRAGRVATTGSVRPAPHTNNSGFPARPRALSCFPSADLGVWGSTDPWGTLSRRHQGVQGQAMPRGTWPPRGCFAAVDANEKQGVGALLPPALALQPPQSWRSVGAQHPPSRWAASKFMFPWKMFACCVL